MNYNEAIEYIHSVSWKGSIPGLERISELCEKLGNPQNDMRFVHITGTNGKGSTCSMTESIIRHSGYKTGLFTSPYVSHFNERMMINGLPVSNEKLARITSYVKPFADSMKDKPTEFELITAIAFLLFKEEKCDIVVLEVGMGGRLDSTNIIKDPILSVITGVSLDHTAFLGDTVQKIAYEKAGIIKQGRDILYCGEDLLINEQDSVFEIIKKHACELGSALHTCDYKALRIKEMTLDHTVFDYGKYNDLQISLLGTYQPLNAVKAVEICEILCKKGFDISEKALREGLKSSIWPARFEKLSSEPTVIYDGGHNREGVEVAIKSIVKYFGNEKINLLTGVMADKDYHEMAKNLSPHVNKVYAVTPDNPRSLSAKTLADLYKDMGHTAESFEDIYEAFSSAVNESKKTGVPLICLGSLYMYAEVIEAKEKYDELCE